MQKEITSKILDIKLKEIQTFDFNDNIINITLDKIEYKPIFKFYFYIYIINVFINDKFYLSITNKDLLKVKKLAKDEVVKIVNIINKLQ